MLELENKIKKFLKEWENTEGIKENSYHSYKIIDGKELSFEDELDSILGTTNEAEFAYIGSFESPGYDASFYCLSLLNWKHEVVSYPIIFESF